VYMRACVHVCMCVCVGAFDKSVLANRAPLTILYISTHDHTQKGYMRGQPTSNFATATHTATHCNALQHTATRCNALQRTATHYKTLHTRGQSISILDCNKTRTPTRTHKLSLYYPARKLKITPVDRISYWCHVSI